MASADILRAARARIEDPKNWTQGYYARTASGEKCSARDPGAVCWCAVGALYVEEHLPMREEDLLRRIAQRQFSQINPPAVNDLNGHDAVLRMYDAAIAAAEAEAGR